MAFCTACGKPIDPSARFCAACGSPAGAATATAGGAAAQPAPLAAAPAPSGGGGLKIVLMVLGVVVALGIVAVIAIAVIGMRIARNSHVETRGENATVSTPFGEFKSTSDPAEVARELGVAVYPGAQGVRGAGSVSMPGLNVAGAEFVTDDSVEQVGDYYRKQFPKTQVDVAESAHQSLIVRGSKGMITINIERRGERTHIHIANLGAKPPNSETQ